MDKGTTPKPARQRPRRPRTERGDDSLETGELHRVYEIVPDESAFDWDVDGDFIAIPMYIPEHHPGFDETGRTLYLGCMWKTCQWQRP